MNFPPKFKMYWDAPGVKAAFISKIDPLSPSDCKNCGGIGTMILFVATDGPFRDAPQGIMHFADKHWWAGKYYEEACPVCKGLGIDPHFVEQPVKQRELDITIGRTNARENISR